MNRHPVVKIGLLGLGTVGSGVVKMLENHPEALLERSGNDVEITKILVRDLDKQRAVDVPRERLTQNVAEIIQDPEIDIIIEVMGGEEETKQIVLAALEQGKHVVTANKDLIALHGAELSRIAEENGVELHYEAAVAGAIPILRALRQSMAADQIVEVMGIVNGTTNYILSKMTGEGASYDEVLAEAQMLGYAEADPYADVSGLDAARKMAILASIAFHRPVALADVAIQGIEKITQEKIAAARAQGGVIKLIGRAQRVGADVLVSVGPMVLSNDHPLALVNDSYNAVHVRGEALGEAMFYGRGAGMMPTASAVVGDLLAVLRSPQMAQGHAELRLAGVLR
ncbi:homoserine dehydrogenase [Tumebacillus sp. DT12]|uniref:Homoserine dehydrogenase n=1 Tax=Tumebacillus lacus TaxID=2995335 RepID=A0ABT3X1T9_9BACL|nr:homoserine dehydrogenase [Tumebacillus lacus]MCX7570875.1 homoserine dehydrogenase [Tumebacillus lacus]